MTGYAYYIAHDGRNARLSYIPEGSDALDLVGTQANDLSPNSLVLSQDNKTLFVASTAHDVNYVTGLPGGSTLVDINDTAGCSWLATNDRFCFAPSADGDLYVIGVGGLAVVATIALPDIGAAALPFPVATPDNRYCLVSYFNNAGALRVVVVDTDILTITATVDVDPDVLDNEVFWMVASADSSTVYISDWHNGDLLVFDVATATVTATVAIADMGAYISLTADGRYVVVPATSGAAFVDTMSLAVTLVPLTGVGHEFPNVNFSAQQNPTSFAFLAQINAEGNFVYVIDTSDLDLIAVVNPVPGFETNIQWLAVTADGSTLYVPVNNPPV